MSMPNYIIIEYFKYRLLISNVYPNPSESYIVFVILPINYFDILLLFRILSEILFITDFNI